MVAFGTRKLVIVGYHGNNRVKCGQMAYVGMRGVKDILVAMETRRLSCEYIIICSLS